MIIEDHTKREIEITWEQLELAAEKGDHRTVILLMKRLDGLGDWCVTARIGEFYETGAIGVERDVDEAFKWYQKAVSDRDDPIAHLGLGRIYYDGCETVEKDLLKAQIHLTKAFVNNLPQAGIHLGMMSMFGVGVEKNLTDAERFFAVAAKGGFPLAYQYMANIAASSGKLIRTIEMLIKELLLTIKLKIEDRNHPNLWKIPK